MTTQYVRPDSVEAAIAALVAAEGDGVILAGGLVVGSIINQNLSIPGVIVDISRIGALRRLEQTDDGQLVLGALVTHDEILRSPIVGKAAPLLAEIAEDIACGRLRNRGTIGGSLCMVGQQGDPATGLIVVEAMVRLRGPVGARLLAVQEFYNDAFSVDLQEGEILEEVLIPPSPPGSGHGFAKIGPRAAMDFTLVVAAARAMPTRDGSILSMRLAVNGVGPTVVRLESAERLMIDHKPEQIDWPRVDKTLQEAISPQGDLVYSESHKRRLAGVALRRATQQAIQRMKRNQGGTS